MMCWICCWLWTCRIVSDSSISAFGLVFISFLLTHILCLISVSQPRLHLPSFYTFLRLTLPSLPPPSALYFSDGMCSCCCLLFPIAVFASQHGDFGIAAELRLPWQRAVLPNCVHLGFGVSLRSLPHSPIYSTFLSGFLWCRRGYQHPSLPASPQPITLKSTLTYVMRHVDLKTKFMSIPAPVPLSLPSSFHLLISLSL